MALTPPVSDDILEGVTRKAIMELLANEGIPVEERSIDRSELYVADEVFLCGTGVQVSPVIEVDHRPVGGARSGRSARSIRERYFDAVRGRLPEYSALADADRVARRVARRVDATARAAEALRRAAGPRGRASRGRW